MFDTDQKLVLPQNGAVAADTTCEARTRPVKLLCRLQVVERSELESAAYRRGQLRDAASRAEGAEAFRSNPCVRTQACLAIGADAL